MATNIKYRLKFAKVNKMRFIGHLDLMKLFARTIRRAQIPIAYSEGFNPHQIMSFAQPLSLGMSSLCEYVDISLAQDVECDAIVKLFNDSLPKGLEVLACKKLEPIGKNSASLLCAASVEITIPLEHFDKQIWDGLVNKTEIVIMKKTKSQNKEVDIRPDIFSLKADDNGKINATLAAGSTQNLKPELLVTHALSLSDKIYEQIDVKICKTEMFAMVDDKFVALI